MATTATIRCWRIRVAEASQDDLQLLPSAQNGVERFPSHARGWLGELSEGVSDENWQTFTFERG